MGYSTSKIFCPVLSTFYENIHVSSHVFVEVYQDNHWIYIDPYFQVYFKDQSGKLLGVKDLRKIIKSKNFDELVPVHFPANVPKNFSKFYKNGQFKIFDLLLSYNFFACFNWIRFTDIQMEKHIVQFL